MTTSGRLLWLWLLAGAGWAPGEASAANAAGIETVRFQSLGVQDGLAHATVRAIAQDSRGFMWFATQDGLSRYDGYEFRVYRRDPERGDALPDNHVLSLAGGRSGELWVGTQNRGLARFDPLAERFESWPVGDPERGELASPTVTALLAHKWGDLWVASGKGKLQLLSQDSHTLTDIAGPVAAQIGTIRALAEAADGSVLIASEHGVWQASASGDDLRPFTIEGGLRPAAFGIVQAFDGSYWVATEDAGVWQVDYDGRLRRRLASGDGLAHDSVRALLLDRAGRLWAATVGGLSRYDTDSGQLQTWRGDQRGDGDDLVAPTLNALFEDREGLLWVGSWTNGLNLHDPRTEAFAVARPQVGNPQALPGFAAIDLLPTAEGQLWVSLHDANRLLRFDLQSGVQETLLSQADGSIPRGGQIRSLAGRDGDLWVTLGKAGLLRRRADGSLQRFQHDPDDPGSLQAGEIYEAYLDRAGTIWVGSIGGGLSARCADCAEFTRYRHDPDDPESLQDDSVTSMLETADGTLWVGTRHGGLASLDRRSGRFSRYPYSGESAHALAHPTVTGMLEDREGRLWIGTQGGGLHLAERDGGRGIHRFSNYDRARGLAADAIGAVLQDASGDIWVSTTAGLSRIDPGAGELSNFGVREGALVGGYYIGSGVLLDDGRLAVGGPRGLSVFDPRDVQLPPAPTQVAISEVRGSSGQSLTMTPIRAGAEDAGERLRLELSEAHDDFSIDLSALTSASPETLYYEYRLDPLSRDWTRSDARRRFATYTNVLPGDYLFRARVARIGGAPSDELQLPVRVTHTASLAEQLRSLALLASLLLLGFVVAMVWQRQRERRTAQQRLAASEQRLKLALWGTGDELWDLDIRSGRMTRENPIQYLRSVGETEVENSSALRQFIHPDDIAPFDQALQDLLRGRSEVLDIAARVMHQDGSWVWLRSRGRAAERDSHGRVIRITGTTADITELKSQQQALEGMNQALEQRVAERTRELSDANQHLEQAIQDLTLAQDRMVEQEKMAALGGLVAGVAHEINTPLGVSVTAASHLEVSTREFSAKMKAGKLTRSDLERFNSLAEESADLIMRNLQRADTLVKSFKQVAVDQSSEERRRIDLAVYLEEILTSLRPALRKTRHQVLSDVPAGIVLDTYPGAIYHIVSNLVQNSLVHAFPAEYAGTMRLSAHRERGELILEYSDDGVGMSEEVRRRVFEPFFTTRRGSGGSGLGMHIVFNTVTRMLHGSIVCDSSPGRGVRIAIRMPDEHARAHGESRR